MDGARVDVVMYPSAEVKAVPAGKGADVVRSYQKRKRSRSRPRRVLLWIVVVLLIAYSLLIVRNFLLGVLAAGIVYLAFHLVPRFSGADAALLDDDVALRDAREQWDAEPVSELTRRGRDRRREREHASEGRAR